MMTLSILYSVNFIGSLICLHADMNKQDNKFNLNNFNFFLSNTYFTCKQIRHLSKIHQFNTNDLSPMSLSHVILTTWSELLFLLSVFF